MNKTIVKILSARNDALIMQERKNELAKMVEEHGIDTVSEASGLKVSTISQYLRDKSPRISLVAVEQARYVFNHPQYVSKTN